MKTISKCQLVCTLVVATALALGVPDLSAQAIGPSCDLLQVDRLIGSVSLQLGVERAVTPAMSCLLSLWREDKGGSTKFVVSNAFLTIMQQNPRTFFSIMANEPKIFEEWLERVEARAFTWPFDPPCQLETSRLHLVSILQNARVDPGQPSSLKDVVTARLSAIRCRQLN